MSKKLGIIGGLGPASSAYFYGMITAMTAARSDQEHLEIMLYSVPQTPDRSAYILGNSNENPAPALIAAAKTLAGLGVGHIALPCVTAHYFYNEIACAVHVPVINMLTETCVFLRAADIGRVGLMSTEGTLAGGLLRETLCDGGIDVLLPTPAEQTEITRLIYGYKAKQTNNPAAMVAAGARMKDAGAEVILLACTELSLVKRDARLGAAYVDMLQILAHRAIEQSGGTVDTTYA